MFKVMETAANAAVEEHRNASLVALQAGAGGGTSGVHIWQLHPEQIRAMCGAKLSPSSNPHLRKSEELTLLCCCSAEARSTAGREPAPEPELELAPLGALERLSAHAAKDLPNRLEA